MPLHCPFGRDLTLRSVTKFETVRHKLVAKGSIYCVTRCFSLCEGGAKNKRGFAVDLSRKLMALAIGLPTLCVPGLASRSSAMTAWLNDAELQRFSNVTIDGRYADGKPFTEHYGSDGRLNYVEHGMTLGGHWSITQGTFCTIYDVDATGGCYRVMRVDTNCYEFYFVSRTEEQAPGPNDGKPRWTARGAIQGQTSACRDEPSV